MNFWETAGATFLGYLGVMIVIGLAKLAWIVYRAKYTGFGQYNTEIARRVNKSAGELAKRLREDGDDDHGASSAG